MAEAVRSSTALSHAEALEHARALLPILKDRSAETETLRQVPERTVRDLHDAGLFRILQPRRYGGSELPFRALVEVCSLIGQGCGSTAWSSAS